LPDRPRIRELAAADLDAACTVVEAAFAASHLGHHGEARLVRELLADGDIVAAPVAETGAGLVGAAVFSRMAVVVDGRPRSAAALAPVAVLPDRWNGGIGGMLIRAGLDRLRDLGVEISFVLGHPAYYPRFGYRAELAGPYRTAYAGPHFMACHLDKALAVPAGGHVDYAPAFARMGNQ
jgi:putative acetyltransferase